MKRTRCVLISFRINRIATFKQITSVVGRVGGMAGAEGRCRKKVSFYKVYESLRFVLTFYIVREVGW